MTPQWDFDFIGRTPSRPKRWPILAVLLVAMLAAMWWQQQRNAEAEALQAAVAQAQQHLREAQLKAQANARAANSQSFDASAWDVAWLDERLRELEACVPGSGVVHQLQYTAAPRSARVSIKEVRRSAVEILLKCLNSTEGASADWGLLNLEQGAESIEITLISRASKTP